MRPLPILLPALALAVGALLAPWLLACEAPPCRRGASIYARDIAPIVLTAGETTRIPLLLSADTRPGADLLIDFALLGCAAAPVTSGPDTRAMGTYRLLTPDGRALPSSTGASTVHTMSGWCLSTASNDAEQLPAVRTSFFDCTGCSVSLILEITPTVTIAAPEIEARLWHTDPGACTTLDAASTAVQIEQFGP